VAELETWLELARMPRALTECGVQRKDLPMLAAESVKQWTANFNPRPMTQSDFLALFEAAL
jgi:alcohol dehydrogenase